MSVMRTTTALQNANPLFIDLASSSNYAVLAGATVTNTWADRHHGRRGHLPGNGNQRISSRASVSGRFVPVFRSPTKPNWT